MSEKMMGTIRNAANYVPLSPISFLERSALVYKDTTSIIYGDISFTWSQTFTRCKALASSLIHQFGISYGHIVVALLPNTPSLYELHFGVPMAGASLCVLNTNYNPAMIAKLVQQSDPKVVFVDTEWVGIIKDALQILSESPSTILPRIVLVQDPFLPSMESELPFSIEYEDLLASSSSTKEIFQVRLPHDELDPISVSFTSGTTSGVPKGVVYSHRGAYLNSMAMVLILTQQQRPYVYLWTVPMCHCNGWCHAWGMAAVGGTNICLRVANTADIIFDSIGRHGITHMGGAPSVLNMLVNSSAPPTQNPVWVMVGGASPPTQLVHDVEKLGFHVIHGYGMTETYGAAATTIENKRGVFKHILMEEIDVKEATTMTSVAWDGQTMGEVVVRGNTVMSGYLKNNKATMDAFQGGWYKTGDYGVRHPDGGIQFKDRSCDVIVSRDQVCVSTVEVEAVLYQHLAVFEAAVVGMPDELLGETVCGFVHLKGGFRGRISDGEIITFCARHLPEHMLPRTLVFVDELPKTTTGKTHKFLLRQKAKGLSG